MIKASQFFDTQDNILWCQSANNRITIGDWFFPDGTVVSTIDSPSHPLHVYHDEGQVGLLRDFGLYALPDLQGLYKCVIPDENDVNQTLWIAAYRDIDFAAGKSIISFWINVDRFEYIRCLENLVTCILLPLQYLQSSYFY